MGPSALRTLGLRRRVRLGPSPPLAAGVRALSQTMVRTQTGTLVIPRQPSVRVVESMLTSETSNAADFYAAGLLHGSLHCSVVFFIHL